MTIGSKSLLYGAHQFLLHPFFVGLGWWKLYGAPLDPRLWVAFFIHDLGYIGKPNMDGPEGKTHPELGARIMEKFFGKEWGAFCRYHSRSTVRRDGTEPSLLCDADKYATLLVPRCLYLTTGPRHGRNRRVSQALQRIPPISRQIRGAGRSTPSRWHGIWFCQSLALGHNAPSIQADRLQKPPNTDFQDAGTFWSFRVRLIRKNSPPEPKK